MSHVKTVSKYVRRSPYQSVAAALLMMLTFFAVTVFALLTIVSLRFLNYFESRPQLTIFFNDQATTQQIMDMKKQFEDTGKTSSVTYVSKQQALQIYKNQNKNNPILLDLVTADTLPASLEIQPVEAEDLSTLANMVKGSPLIEQVIYQADLVNTLISWISAFKIIGAVIIGVLVLVSVFVILTIIGIKITVRRDEIGTMKLMGASNWFIRFPFLLEGMAYGFIGAILGWMVSVLALLYFTPAMESFFNNVPVFPLPPLILVELLVLEIAIAVALGMFASFLAVLRYLKG